METKDIRILLGMVILGIITLISCDTLSYSIQMNGYNNCIGNQEIANGIATGNGLIARSNDRTIIHTYTFKTKCETPKTIFWEK